jgi:mono/diheme cytochrome c family protein
MIRRFPSLAGAAALALSTAFVLVGFGGANQAGPVTVDTTPIPQAAVSFANDVMPIFEATCIGCHGAPGDDGEPRKEAYLDLTTYEGLMTGSEYGTVVEPGNADDSVLMDMIVTGDMPSQDDGPVDPLTEEQIDVIRQWINEGAENN